MVFAIADVKRTALDEDTVRPLKFARQRIAIGTVTALAGTNHGGNHSVTKIDPPNDMTFSVGDVNGALCRIGDTFRSVEFCRQRLSTGG